jgi:3-hydroxy-9,10-secoandrosta-1,3,5(10)-triene-9,17-dione monooxygenase reductase component
VTIHSSDPFATPEGQRSPVRRLRSRLTAPVTVWTAPGPAGLTVSSVLVADGQPGLVLGLIDEESEFWTAAQAAGRFAVTPLRADQRQLADRFAGLLPAPGGLFAQEPWQSTPYGPVPVDAPTWAGCRLLDATPAGWSLLVRAQLDEVVAGPEEHPLAYFRGRYRELS